MTSENRSINEILDAAALCLRNHSVQEAIHLCDKALAMDGRNSLAYHTTGIAMLQAGNIEQASEFLKRSIELRQPDPQWQFALGISLEMQKKYLEAQQAFEGTLQSAPTSHEALIHHAQVCLNQGLFKETLDSYSKALAHYPQSDEAIKGYASLGDAISNYSNAYRTGTHFDPTTNANSRYCIVVNGQECSAGIFVTEEIRQALQITARQPITNGIRLDCTVIPERLKLQVDHGGISHGHIYPRIENLLMLHCGGLKKFIVQLRDPRQALLSLGKWYETSLHVAIKDRTELNERLVRALVPDDYFSLNDAKKIDVLIETRLPWVINFIDGWWKASVDPQWDFNILFTTFEDFKSNRTGFYSRIADFYSINPAEFKVPEKEKTPPVKETSDVISYFRKGSIDEWRSVVTSAQAEKMQAMMPPGLLQRFGWKE